MGKSFQAEVLGKLLQTQKTLSALTSQDEFAAYLSDTLKEVPGCACAHVCVGGALHPLIQDVQAPVCSDCAVHGHEGKSVSPIACRVPRASNPLHLPMRTENKVWGNVLLDITDVELVKPYFPFIESLLGSAATFLEKKYGASDLLQANSPANWNRRMFEMKTLEPAQIPPFAHTEEASLSKAGDQSSLLHGVILDSLPANIVMLDSDGRILAVNRNWTQFVQEVGASEDEGGLGGDYLKISKKLFPEVGDGDAVNLKRLQAVLRGEQQQFQFVYECATLQPPRWFRVIAVSVRGMQNGAVVMHMDVTAQKEADARAHFLAYYDSLTGLPNRLMMMNRLQQVIDESEFSQCHAAVLTLDMGKFRRINEAIGHAKGDILLKEFGERLCENVRANDMVGRLGGDRFLMILSGIKDEMNVSEVVRTIQEKLLHPYALDEREYFISASIGVSIYPKDGTDVETLFKHADAAMYQAKANEQHHVCYYNDELGQEGVRRLSMEAHLRHALERNELVMYYQPQVDLNSGYIIGAEALIRWQHPELGLISPVEFIPLAEEIGVIDSIGEWALNMACMRNKAWQDAGLRTIRVAVNVSPRQFHLAGFADTVKEALQKSGLSPEHLELEITEGMVMQHIEHTMATLYDLKMLGIALSVDDFGTGYSSLAYLKRFPINALKIDQSFVREITTDVDSAMIVKAIISMAHSLHLKTIAEGVETEEQLALLISHHCDELQGFLFSKPLAEDEFTQLLKNDKPLELGNGLHHKEARLLLVVDDDPLMCDAIVKLFDGSEYQVLTADSAASGMDVMACKEVGVVLVKKTLSRTAGDEFARDLGNFYPESECIFLADFPCAQSELQLQEEGELCPLMILNPWNGDHLKQVVEEAFERYESSLERWGRAHFIGKAA